MPQSKKKVKESTLRVRVTPAERAAFYAHAGEGQFSEWVRRALTAVMLAEQQGCDLAGGTAPTPTPTPGLRDVAAAELLVDLAEIIAAHRAEKQQQRTRHS